MTKGIQGFAKMKTAAPHFREHPKGVSLLLGILFAIMGSPGATLMLPRCDVAVTFSNPGIETTCGGYCCKQLGLTGTHVVGT